MGNRTPEVRAVTARLPAVFHTLVVCMERHWINMKKIVQIS
jgi:hypothetical protein